MDELGRNPEKMLGALYGDRPHQFHEDGLRFPTLALLQQHTDRYLERKKLLQRRRDKEGGGGGAGAVVGGGGGVVGGREHREWYCSTAQWVTDFNALSGGGEGSAVSGGSHVMGSIAAGREGENEEDEEFVVPADEHFTRCPVSREVFECLWDAEEGEMMYRNAVKVLLTEAADPALFQQAQPIPWDTVDAGTAEGGGGSPVRYIIVHKLLVLNQWLASGRAAPLQDAVWRYKSIPGVSGQAKADRILRAVGEDDDDDDIFVLLEFSS